MSIIQQASGRLCMKHQKKREHRLANAMVKSTSFLSSFSDSIPVPSSLPDVSDLN